MLDSCVLNNTALDGSIDAVTLLMAFASDMNEQPSTNLHSQIQNCTAQQSSP